VHGLKLEQLEHEQAERALHEIGRTSHSSPRLPWEDTRRSVEAPLAPAAPRRGSPVP
jgi:hypothetical protein